MTLQTWTEEYRCQGCQTVKTFTLKDPPASYMRRKCQTCLDAGHPSRVQWWETLRNVIERRFNLPPGSVKPITKTPSPR